MTVNTMNGTTKPHGSISHVVIPKDGTEYSVKDVVNHGLPHRGLSKEVNRWRMRNFFNLLRGLWRVLLCRWLKIHHVYGAVFMTVIRADGQVIHYGLASFRVVTNDGVDFIVDAFQNTTELENMRYHGIGTGSTAEAATDSALVTEITTEYETNNTRPTGTTTEGASSNIYRTVATNTVDGAVACEEHGIFDQASNAGGVLLDRSVFSVINLSNGDSLQSTYDLTFSAGG